MSNSSASGNDDHQISDTIQNTQQTNTNLFEELTLALENALMENSIHPKNLQKITDEAVIKKKLREQLTDIIPNNLINDSEHDDDGKNLSLLSLPLIKFGLYNNNGMRYIILLLSRLKVVPSATTIKYAIVAETRYGSYMNAELLFTLLLALFDMNIYNWNDSQEALEVLKSLCLLIRHAPSCSLAMNYHKMATDLCEEHELEISEHVYCCVIFNIILTISTLDPETDKQEIYELDGIVKYYHDELRKIGKCTQVTDSIMSSYLERSSNQSSVEDDDDNVTVASFSSAKTNLIDLQVTTHAELRMKERNISLYDIQKCIKYGNMCTSSDRIKSTDEQLIVIFSLQGTVPVVLTTYRHMTKEKLKEYMDQNTAVSDIIAYCDFLLTTALYDDFSLCSEVISFLLNMDVTTVSSREKDVLKETLYYLFKDCASTYEDLEILVNLMKHFSIVYSPIVTKSKRKK